MAVATRGHMAGREPGVSESGETGCLCSLFTAACSQPSTRAMARKHTVGALERTFLADCPRSIYSHTRTTRSGTNSDREPRRCDKKRCKGLSWKMLCILFLPSGHGLQQRSAQQHHRYLSARCFALPVSFQGRRVFSFDAPRVCVAGQNKTKNTT